MNNMSLQPPSYNESIILVPSYESMINTQRVYSWDELIYMNHINKFNCGMNIGINRDTSIKEHKCDCVDCAEVISSIITSSYEYKDDTHVEYYIDDQYFFTEDYMAYSYETDITPSPIYTY